MRRQGLSMQTIFEFQFLLFSVSVASWAIDDYISVYLVSDYISVWAIDVLHAFLMQPKSCHSVTVISNLLDNITRWQTPILISFASHFHHWCKLHSVGRCDPFHCNWQTDRMSIIGLNMNVSISKVFTVQYECLNCLGTVLSWQFSFKVEADDDKMKLMLR
jgi:hypothetical protein